MTPDEMLRQKLAKWRPTGTGPHFLTVAHGSGWTVLLTADRSDELGCLIRELTLQHTPAPPAIDHAALRARADRVAARVSGLMEPLKVVEVDVRRGEAQLRSGQPAARDDQLAYYEVLLKGAGEANIRRYQAEKQPGTRREQVPFALTHEVLAKLAADLIGE